MNPEILLFVLMGLVLIQSLFIFMTWKKSAAPAQEDGRLARLQEQNEKLERVLRDELSRAREETQRGGRELREEVSGSLKNQGESGVRQIESLSKVLKDQLQLFAEQNSKLTGTIEGKLQLMQDNNTRKLDEMRQTVDEKLQGTLEKRLGESFKLVSERLEQVHKGLGEMQTLASGVGDLKRVLTNVKTRGTWGEIQLRGILEQILPPGRFEANVKIHPAAGENVEFAIKLPGLDKESPPVWLPIDSKFPKESYEKIVDAQDRADADILKSSRDELAKSLRTFAKKIRDTYISPPSSTDFAILFLPTEGLFAEVCQYPGLLDSLQREYRVTVAGPTTMSVLLNSLTVGFRTIALHEQSAEIWRVLGLVKDEFGKFGNVLDAVEKKLEQAGKEFSKVRSKTKTINRALRKVEELPGTDKPDLLSLAGPGEDLGDDAEESEDAEA